MKIALALYPGFTALDIIGPFQVLSALPGVDVRFVAHEKGLVLDHTGRLSMEATERFDALSAPDVLVVPGGLGTERLIPHDPILAWIRRAHETSTWTTSVCTGSLLLAAAGVLEGLEATTHWAAMDALAALGAKPTSQRVVFQGKVVTAAGVSAGIDMGLALVERMYGRTLAEVIQLAIEYDPMPPVDAGSPAKARPEVVALARAALADPAKG